MRGLLHTGSLEEALKAGNQAGTLTSADMDCHHDLAVVHYDRLELIEAIAHAERALALVPSFVPAHLLIASASLLRGDFARGWDEFEWRAGSPEVRSQIFDGKPPPWDGRRLGNRSLLLVADQGHGDIIHFSRYIPWAAERCRNLVVWCRKDALPLLVQQKEIRRLVAGGTVVGDFAAWASLSGLPQLALTRLNTIPARIPYLRAIPNKRIAWARRLAAVLPAGHRRVGLVWAGQSSHANDRNRSMRLTDLSPLGDVPRVALVSLQKGAARTQILKYGGRAPLIDLGDEIGDYADTAAIIASLDVVITVDTSVAHLAGAMGEPAWVMLPFAPDWRWLLKRRDSPWYPSLRLFRQPQSGRWDLVVGKIKRELEHALANPSSRTRKEINHRRCPLLGSHNTFR